MFTFLFTVAVVAVAIAAAVSIALRDPDQPATLSPQIRDALRRLRLRRPARRRRRSPQPAAAPSTPTVAPPATVAVAEPARRGGGFADQWVPVPAGWNVWVRVRSGFVLTVLLTVVGALLAVSVSGLLLVIALAVRNAVD